ncbi:hypothetical protein N9H34_01500 [bacterium]|nr:hypothetical protein [bacterium]
MDSHTLEMVGIIIVAVITAILGPTIVEIVKIKLRKKVTIDPIKNEVAQSATILDELDDIRITLEGDRVWVKMYHNGGHFLLTNKSIQKFSVMYESCSTGVSNVGHIFTNIPISLYQRSTHQLMEHGHLYIPDFNDPKVATYGLKGAAESTGTVSTYAIALHDIGTNKCIGTIGIDYLKKNKLSKKELIFLNQRAERIGGYLSNFLN